MIHDMATPSGQTVPDQSGRMSDHLVRLHNLKLLQRANGWDDSELARRCERSPQQVHAWKQGTRHIGERLARKLEEALGLNRYALDDRAGTHVAEPPPKWGVPAVSGGSAKSHAKEMPIVRSGRSSAGCSTPPPAARRPAGPPPRAALQHRECQGPVPRATVRPVRGWPREHPGQRGRVASIACPSPAPA